MRKKFKIVVLFISVFSIAFWSCDTNKTKESTEKNPEDVVVEKPNVAVPFFNQDSAFLYVEEQVAFGPRVPNTAKHDQCAAYLINKLKSFGLSVIVQEAKVKAFDNSTLNIKNIIDSMSDYGGGQNRNLLQGMIQNNQVESGRVSEFKTNLGILIQKKFEKLQI